MTPKLEAELLMNEGIKFARQMLSLHGEFHPYANALRASGEIVSVGASDGTEFPRAQALLDILVSSCQEAAVRGDYSAVGIFSLVTIARPSDKQRVNAVQVGLEHKAGYCADLFFPYTLKPGGVDFGQIFAQVRDPVVFAPN